MSGEYREGGGLAALFLIRETRENPSMNDRHFTSRSLASSFVWIATATLCVIAVSSLLGTSRAHAENPSGVWRGQWTSQSSGHRGALGAKIRPAGPDHYKATFYGRFAVVIPFFYRTTLDRIPGTTDMYYSAKKMPLLGTYETTARISGSHFRADFVGKKDRGVFEMRRRR